MADYLVIAYCDIFVYYCIIGNKTKVFHRIYQIFKQKEIHINRRFSLVSTISFTMDIIYFIETLVPHATVCNVIPSPHAECEDVKGDNILTSQDKEEKKTSTVVFTSDECKEDYAILNNCTSLPPLWVVTT